jgi:choline dehydrogenase
MKWDYIIVGAGSAGCAAAHELVKSGQRVLVLEAGPSDRSLAIKFPAGVLRACQKFDWGYRAQPDSSRGGKSESWYRGRVLGGSSSINGMKYVRAAAADFDRWAELCGQTGGWSAREILPIFREIENSDQAGLLRGHIGPLYVRTVKKPHPISQAFIESAREAGYVFNSDYNADTQEGVAYAQFSQRRGLRCSSADAFLKPHLGKRNLTLWLHSLVEKIEIKNGCAKAVVLRHKGQLRRETTRNVILCAGAINSPKLLMLSGIGDREELNRHGIEAVLDLPGVGENFQDQPFLRLTYRVRVPTYNLTEGILQRISIAAKFLLYGEGPISNLFEGVAFLRSSPSEPIPDIRLTFLALGIAKMADGSSGFTPYPGVTISLMKSYPAGRGRIRLASADPDQPPLIECPLLQERADIDTLIRGIHTIRRIMGSEPIASLVDEEVSPGGQVQTEPALESFIRKHSSIPYHSIGSCRMGVSENAVVGPNLRVHGMQNLWIADASIMPTHISADTNATCMMIGAKLGRQLCALAPRHVSP